MKAKGRQRDCSVSPSSEGDDSSCNEGEKKGKKKRKRKRKQVKKPESKKPRAIKKLCKKKATSKENVENDLKLERNLSKVYAMEPRWNALTRCANWVNQLPSFTCSSTSRSKSSICNESLYKRNSSKRSRRHKCPSSSNVSSSRRHLYMDKSRMSPEEQWKHRSEFDLKKLSKLRRKLKIIHDALKRKRKPAKSPFVSAKQRSESARETCLKNYQIGNESCMKKSRRRNPYSKKKLGRTADMNYFRRKANRLRQEYNNCGKNGLKFGQSRLYFLRKGKACARYKKFLVFSECLLKNFLKYFKTFR